MGQRSFSVSVSDGKASQRVPGWTVGKSRPPHTPSIWQRIRTVLASFISAAQGAAALDRSLRPFTVHPSR